MKVPPSSERSYIAGPTGSGKSHLLRVMAAKHPRQLVMDVTGEWANPEGFRGTVVYASTVGELAKSLDMVAGAETWRIVMPAERADPQALVALLAPPYEPGRTSFPRAVGGLALVVDEAAELAANQRAFEVRPLWLRGRHHGLSILAASQRAADVGRMVTSQSEVVAITRTMEPLDLAYWQKFLRRSWFQALLELENRQAVEVNRVTQTARVITTAGELVRQLPDKGQEGPGQRG